jgi:putative transposase
MDLPRRRSPVATSPRRATIVSVDYRSTNKVVYSTKYHLIWCPKYRRRVLTGDVERRLIEIVHDVCDELSVVVIGLETMPEHVHLLCENPPVVALSTFVGRVKGRSSRPLRQEFPRLQRLAALWSPSWFVSTVGGAPLDVIKRYVENQKMVT